MDDANTMIVGYVIVGVVYFLLMTACMWVSGDAKERRTFAQLSTGAVVWPLMLLIILVWGVVSAHRRVFVEIDKGE